MQPGIAFLLGLVAVMPQEDPPAGPRHSKHLTHALKGVAAMVQRIGTDDDIETVGREYREEIFTGRLAGACGRSQLEIVEDGVEDIGQGVHGAQVYLPPRPVETHGGQRTGPHIQHLDRIPIGGR